MCLSFAFISFTKNMSLDGSWCLCSPSIPPWLSQAEYWTEYSEMTIKCLSPTCWWQVPGEMQEFVSSCQLTSLKRAIMWEPSRVAGKFVSPPNLWPSFTDMVFLKCTRWWIVAAQREQTSLPILSRYTGGNVFWKGKNWCEMLWRSGQKAFISSRISYSLCHLGSHYCWWNAVLHLKHSNNDCTSDMDRRFKEGLERT